MSSTGAWMSRLLLLSPLLHLRHLVPRPLLVSPQLPLRHMVPRLLLLRPLLQRKIGVYGELPRVVLRSLSLLLHLWLLVLLSLACHMLLPPQLLFWHPLLSPLLHLLHLVLFTLGHWSLVRLMLPKLSRLALLGLAHQNG